MPPTVRPSNTHTTSQSPWYVDSTSKSFTVDSRGRSPRDVTNIFYGQESELETGSFILKDPRQKLLVLKTVCSDTKTA